METEKQLGQFDKAIRRGRYMFHIHTDWTDGVTSLANYCIAAKEIGFKSIIPLEHVRRECVYDFRAFMRMVEEQKNNSDMEIHLGAEAKILPDGSLDISEMILSNIQVLGIAEHSFKGDTNTLFRALSRAFRSFKDAEFARVWVHPGKKLLQQQPESYRLFQEAIQIALESNVYIEVNLYHKLPPEQFFSLVPLPKVVVGLDAHSIDDIKLFGEIAFDLESKIGHEVRKMEE